MTDLVDARRVSVPGGRAARVEVAAIDLAAGPASAILDLRGRRPSAPVPDSLDRAPHSPARPGITGHAVAVDVADDDAALAALASRWLTPAERAIADSLGPRARCGRIAGRVAAKQAIQAGLTEIGFAHLDAARIQITNDAHGVPVPTIRGARVATRHLRVSIAHAAGVAVALATTASRTATHAPGIDVEPVEERSHRFERLTMTAAERALEPVPGDDRDTWLTRLWSAKEAAAKATGRGLQGRPKDFAVSRVVDHRLRIGDRWVVTECLTVGGRVHVVARTENERTECAWHRS